MIDAYQSALTHAALFNLTGVGVVRVCGPDAASFLNNISTNDTVNLAVGNSCETYFCDHRAKVLFQANVQRVDRDTFILDTAAGYGAKLLAHLDRYLISEAVELEDLTATQGLLHVAGPTAETAVRAVVADARRRDLLGVPGYDLFCDTKEIAFLIEKLLVVEGSAEIFETLRIEAGTPVYGKDIDENRFVMEVASAARAVCYTKGCFIGQEPIVMSRDRAGQVNRLFLGLKVLNGGPLLSGTKITKDGAEVGVVTSSCVSPRLGAPLALGYLKRPHIETGMKFMAGEQEVEVLGYPPLPQS